MDKLALGQIVHSLCNVETHSNQDLLIQTLEKENMYNDHVMINHNGKCVYM